MSLIICLLSFLGMDFPVQPGPSIRPEEKVANSQYELKLNDDASVMILHKPSGKAYRLRPRFTIMKRADDPRLRFSWRSDKFAPETGNNFLRLAYWKQEGSGKETADFFQAAAPLELTAGSGKMTENGIGWNFSGRFGTLEARLSLESGIDEPVISYSFAPAEDGYYSVGYTGMPETAPASADAIWQPFVWQEKRFPEKCFLSTEDMCGLPGTMVEKDGMTLGVLADPRAIPYRLPYQPTGNILFGVLIRNREGNAQPQIFAPVFGNPDSKLTAGREFRFRFRVFMYEGSQPDAYLYAARHVFDFRDYRENVYVNLNKTIENTINFQMDDVYSRWSPEMKGFDYSTDVAHTVKNVSALHPLSAAVITDNKGIYTRRALPVIEYLLSREKYLFSVKKNVTGQQASSHMNGPAIEVSELAALDIFYKGESPVFAYFADSLSHTTRQLNLRKESEGDDWLSLLSLYRMTGRKDYLDRAKQKADEYIRQRITTRQTDFSRSATEQSAMFWTDFSPLWMELLSLYEETGEQRYLDAAEAGAKQYMQYTWFFPVIPDSTIVVNENGIVEFLCQEAIRDHIPPMVAPRQEVPAWRLSQIGLTPEATYTSSWNPAIFLACQAPHLLRLAYYTKNEFFRWVARSAVVGRYTNYPGYDINGEFNTVYSRPDYPLRYQHEVSYNQFYYNHVWPQIAMLFDYLISDVYVSSDGAVNFPGEFAEGYAYLKSNVYGQEAGTFYGDRDVRLWMPEQVLKTGNEQINYLTAYGNGRFYVVLLNQCSREIETEISVNPDLVPVKMNDANRVRLWKDNRPAGEAYMKDGRLRISVSPKGITAFAVEGVPVEPQFRKSGSAAATPVASEPVSQSSPDGTSYRMVDTPFGKVRSAMFSFAGLNDAYIWLEASSSEIEEATFSYRRSDAGSGDWISIKDTLYPFEFSVPLKPGGGAASLRWKVTVRTADGMVQESPEVLLEQDR